MDKPANGPITDYGPFIRNAQPIGGGLFLVEAQRGTKGRGKMWYQTVIAPDPRYGKPKAYQPGKTHDHRWQEVGEVKLAVGKYQVAGTMKARVYGIFADDLRRYVEGYFPNELEAVQFMVANATRLFA